VEVGLVWGGDQSWESGEVECSSPYRH
jgi:hypothetical protein